MPRRESVAGTPGRSRLEQALETQFRAAKLPQWECEYRFHPTRRWRFDFAWPAALVAVEAEGGTCISGRHTRPGGSAADAVKYGTAAALGWRVIRVTRGMIDDGTALALVEQALNHVKNGF